MRRLALFALPFMFVAGLCDARPLAAPEEKALAKAVDGYLGAIETGRAEQVVAAIPPRILDLFAKQSDMDVGALQAILVDQTSALLSQSAFSALSAKVKGADATDSTLPDGTSVTWAIVPMQFVVKAQGSRTRNTQPMLALLEQGRWYFIRIEGAAQSRMVSLAYPFTADARYPAATATPLK